MDRRAAIGLHADEDPIADDAAVTARVVVTLLLSMFLNNVATAIIMGPLAIDAAHLLGVNPDAALLAVLIGVSSIS